MERESFESEEVAKIMNDNFVNIKVDREERPDIDKVYMTFVQVSNNVLCKNEIDMTRGFKWPLLRRPQQEGEGGRYQLGWHLLFTLFLVEPTSLRKANMADQDLNRLGLVLVEVQNIHL